MSSVRHNDKHLIRIEAEEMRDFIGWLFKNGIDCQSVTEAEAKEKFLEEQNLTFNEN